MTLYNPGINVKKIHYYSINLYSQLEAETEQVFCNSMSFVSSSHSVNGRIHLMLFAHRSNCSKTWRKVGCSLVRIFKKKQIFALCRKMLLKPLECILERWLLDPF